MSTRPLTGITQLTAELVRRLQNGEPLVAAPRLKFLDYDAHRRPADGSSMFLQQITVTLGHLVSVGDGPDIILLGGGRLGEARTIGFEEIKKVGQGVDPELDREVALLIENPLLAFRFLRASVLRRPEGADSDGRGELLGALEVAAKKAPVTLGEQFVVRDPNRPLPPNSLAAQAAARPEGAWLLFEDHQLVDAADTLVELRHWPRVEGRRYLVVSRDQLL